MKKINWGILATGGIANTFADALCHTENAVLYAVASRSEEKAKAFADKFNAVTYYGSYEALCSDKNIDVIYIATPMGSHYENAKMCLEHGKNVLCEKTVTLNVGQFDSLVSIAHSRNLFFMEAMWMKFLPMFIKAQEWFKNGRIGNIRYIKADFTFLNIYTPGHRFYEKALGGGALLDLGVYPITFAASFLGKKPTAVKTSAYLGKTGVDFDAGVLLEYDNACANLSFGFDITLANQAVIVGDKGRIVFGDCFFCTDDIELFDDKGNSVEKCHLKKDYNGYEYEIREVMNCLYDNKKESSVVPLSDTRDIMLIMDECRKQWGMTFDNE